MRTVNSSVTIPATGFEERNGSDTISIASVGLVMLHCKLVAQPPGIGLPAHTTLPRLRIDIAGCHYLRQVGEFG